MQNYVHSEMVRLSASYGGQTGSSNALKSNRDFSVHTTLEDVEPSTQAICQPGPSTQRPTAAKEGFYDSLANCSPVLCPPSTIRPPVAHKERNFSSKPGNAIKPVKISKFFKLSYEEINEYLHSSYPISAPGVISCENFDTTTAAADVNHLQALDQTTDPELVLVNKWITKLQTAINNAQGDSDSEGDAYLYEL
jgi:hypothetical protein